MHLIHRTTCRVCKSSALTKVIDLGEQYLQGSFVKPGRQEPPLRRVPTSLVRCDPMRDEKACGLLQMEYTVPPEVLYSVYWYRSGTNATMRNHLARHRRGGDRALGKPGGARPRHRLQRRHAAGGLPQGVHEVRHRSVGPRAARSPAGHQGRPRSVPLGGADVASSTGKPATSSRRSRCSTTSRIRSPSAGRSSACSSPDGLWCIEMSYMPTMLKMTSYDTICHEHLEYYSLAVLEYILRQAGLRLVNVALNDINGGSHPLLRHARGQRRATARDEFTRQHHARCGRQEFDLRARHRQAVPPLPGARRTSTASELLGAAARSCARRASACTSTARRPRATRSCSGAASTSRLVDVRRRAQPRQVRRAHAGHGHPDRQRGRIARGQAGLLPGPALALPRRVPRAREGHAGRRRRHDLPAADHRDRKSFEGRMKALVFGANGQDGPYLCEALREKRRGRDRDLPLGPLVAGRRRRPRRGRGGVRSARPDYIFQLAAQLDHPARGALRQPRRDLDRRAERSGGASACTRRPPGSSSPARRVQFKNVGQPIDEEAPFEASSPYAVARIQSVYAARYFRSLGLRTYVGYLFHHDSPAAVRARRAADRPGGPADRRRQRRGAGAGRYRPWSRSGPSPATWCARC